VFAVHFAHTAHDLVFNLWNYLCHYILLGFNKMKSVYMTVGCYKKNH